MISNLESELSGYEAMGVDELSESMVALGLAGTSKADGKNFMVATLPYKYNYCLLVDEFLYLKLFIMQFTINSTFF